MGCELFVLPPKVIPKHPAQMKRLLCIQKERVGHPGRRDRGGSSCVPKEPLGRRWAGRAQGGGEGGFIQRGGEQARTKL
eukprot:gene23760-biopygen2858